MTNAVKKIVRSYFGKTDISIDGLIELFEQTGNADVALDTLLGTYEPPQIPSESSIWRHHCTFKSFNKWTNQVSFTYVAPNKDYIYVDKDVDTKLITPENYRDYKRNYDTPNVKHVYVTIEHEAIHEDKCSLPDWIEGVKQLKTEA